MCGVIGISGLHDVNLRLYDALTILQHRGQAAAGLVTEDGGECDMDIGSYERYF